MGNLSSIHDTDVHNRTFRERNTALFGPIGPFHEVARPWQRADNMKRSISYRLLTLVIGILVALFIILSVITRTVHLPDGSRTKSNSGVKELLREKTSELFRVFAVRF